ncbi:MAG: AAA family ATPase [Candidatus Kapaibacterium sp.]
MKIEQIRLEGLFGELNYDIRIDDNKLILVAENGSGKTTIVNIIYYFLSRQWSKLLRYRFDKISGMINGEWQSVNRTEIDILSSENLNKILKRYPPTMKERIRDFIMIADMDEVYRNPVKMEIWADRANLPIPVIYEIISALANEHTTASNKLVLEKEKHFSDLIDCQILYLPTFRRIEQDLKAIFPDLESDIDKYKRRKRGLRSIEDAGYVELVEFGMEDVEDKIKLKLSSLRDNLSNKIKHKLTGGYLKDVINREYRKISEDQIQAINEESLSSMLSRIDDTVLSQTEKTSLMQFVSEINIQGSISNDEDKIIALFIYKLSTIYNELKEEEKDVEKFISICNLYSSNKQFIYDNINFNISIRAKTIKNELSNETIELKDLSSGEKQIVSLFSHLFLSQQKNFFIIIDEPELSLSVPWQKKFIVDVINNPYCKGLLSVTHSPFIFAENILNNFTHALDEFSY